MTPDHEACLPVPPGYDLEGSLRLLRLGPHDPTWRVGTELVHAFFGPEGPVTVALWPLDSAVRVRCWGPGTSWILPRLPALLGAGDDPAGFRPDHPVLAPLAARSAGVRLPVHPDLLEPLTQAILQQRVAWRDALRSWQRLCRSYGEPAPGPHGLRTPPDPERLARLAYEHLHPAGVERRRAGLLIGVHRRHATLRRLTPREAPARLLTVPGIGPWTAGLVAGAALGHADAVPVGDLHLPHIAASVLTGAPRGDDATLLRLLAPYRPHRWRVVRLLLLAGARARRAA